MNSTTNNNREYENPKSKKVATLDKKVSNKSKKRKANDANKPNKKLKSKKKNPVSLRDNAVNMKSVESIFEGVEFFENVDKQMVERLKNNRLLNTVKRKGKKKMK